MKKNSQNTVSAKKSVKRTRCLQPKKTFWTSNSQRALAVFTFKLCSKEKYKYCWSTISKVEKQPNLLIILQFLSMICKMRLWNNILKNAWTLISLNKICINKLEKCSTYFVLKVTYWIHAILKFSRFTCSSVLTVFVTFVYFFNA